MKSAYCVHDEWKYYICVEVDDLFVKEVRNLRQVCLKRIKILSLLFPRDVIPKFFDCIAGCIDEFHPHLIRFILNNDFNPSYFSKSGNLFLHSIKCEIYLKEGINGKIKTGMNFGAIYRNIFTAVIYDFLMFSF